MRRLTVRYERDEAGWWVPTVPKLRGCHTQGRTLEEARRRAREAMALFIEDAESVEIRDEILLPKEVQRTIKKVSESRRTAAKFQQRSAAALEKAISQLSERLNLSTRDQADLLGLSHQRIHQIKRKRAEPRFVSPTRAERRRGHWAPRRRRRTAVRRTNRSSGRPSRARWWESARAALRSRHRRP